MPWAWGEFRRNSRQWLKTGWLITAGLVAVYAGAIEPLQIAREKETSRTTGLGAVPEGAPSRSVLRLPSREEIVGGTAREGEDKQQAAIYANLEPSPTSQPEEGRKLVRTCSMDLIAANPAGTAEKIRQMAERMGGYLESSQVNGSQATANASLTIRVPATRIEEARAEIRKLGLRVGSDQLEAQDVTKDYVDRDARLRNLRAQEQQYLAILKRATTVKDTLEVSQQLDEVRGQIEQQQAEFDTLAKQVETVAITVSLSTEADAQVLGLNWRPLYRFKMAAREGLNGLGEYVATITGLAFYLPTVLLWLATILVGAAVGWRILRWAARILFSRKTILAEKAAN
jgi:hypothetical protein